MVAPTRILRASWSSTLRLPKSSFPPRPSPAAKAEYLHRCTDDFYAWQQSSGSSLSGDEKASETFTLHDGPPYANGPLHIGHALNKITKDIICRFQVGQGKRVSYIPGWDCHGLPIEIKALQAQQKDHADTDPVSVREAARELAAKTVEEQKKGFKEWAVMGDWENAYKTMDKGFEIRQLEVFKTMFERGLIYRQNKPVYWSPSSRTALAEAELEYDENHRSLAAFVRFPVVVSDELRRGALSKLPGPLNIVIWTTTPWTLPANKAVAVNKDMQYCVAQNHAKGNELTLVAASRLAEYQKLLECELSVVCSGLRGSDVAGHLHYENPFQRENGLQPVVHADFVTDTSGTGLVHLAPGHGMDDYHVCSALGIQAFAPIDDAGAFTKDAFPEHPELLEGLPVADAKKTGSNVILSYLEERDMLRAKQNYRHKYPIDWRTKQPVIVRATEQWFADVEGIKASTLNAIASVNFMPETGRHRLESFIQGRSQWCISRQRAWGVPIPALYKIVNEEKHEAVMDSKTIRHIINVIKERGIDAWWTDGQDDPTWVPEHLSGSYVRGRDTMDVWFDSGTSWTMLPGSKDQPAADVYLEGTDQHRGWFQSSLLTHVATQPSGTGQVNAPYKTLITHGFTLDSEGRKMSKSLGNVVSPSQIMSGELLPPIKRKKQKGKQEQSKNETAMYDAMGTDALRLWVAGSDYLRDVTVGQPVLLSVNQALHKYRVTFKWLLGVFSLPSCPPVFSSFNDVRTELSTNRASLALLADKVAHHRLTQVSQEVQSYYTKYEFFKGVNTINKYISNDLSAFYFETLKDRIYTGHKADCQHLQKILGLVFYELLQMLAPICPLLVEEVWDHVPEALRQGSVHPARVHWVPLPLADAQTAKDLDAAQRTIDTLGRAIKAAQERLRTAKKIGSSLETSVTVFRHVPHPSRTSAVLELPAQTRDAELAALFLVSGFEEVLYGGHLPDWGVPERHDTRRWKDITSETDWWEMEEFDDEEAGPGGKGAVVVHRPGKEKCPRCWRFEREKEAELCARCEDVVREEGTV